MTNFLEVAKNWGDFSRSGHLEPTGQRSGSPLFDREANLMRAPAADFDSYRGDTAYTDAEPGYRPTANIAARMQARYGRRVYEARMAEACRLIVRGLNGSKRDLLNLQEA